MVRKLQAISINAGSVLEVLSTLIVSHGSLAKLLNAVSVSYSLFSLLILEFRIVFPLQQNSDAFLYYYSHDVSWSDQPSKHACERQQDQRCQWVTSNCDILTDKPSEPFLLVTCIEYKPQH